MLDEWLRRYLTFYISLINTCKKNTPPHTLLKHFMEIWGVKKNYSYSLPNILEGNGVVFGNFTFNNLQLEVFTFYL